MADNNDKQASNKQAANSQFRKLRQAEDGKRAMLDYETRPPPCAPRPRAYASCDWRAKRKTLRPPRRRRRRRRKKPRKNPDRGGLVLILDRRARAVAAARGLGVPLAASSSYSISSVLPGLPARRRLLWRRQARGVGRERFGERRLLCRPSRHRVDDLIGDFRHAIPSGFACLPLT